VKSTITISNLPVQSGLVREDLPELTVSVLAARVELDHLSVVAVEEAVASMRSRRRSRSSRVTAGVLQAFAFPARPPTRDPGETPVRGLALSVVVRRSDQDKPGCIAVCASPDCMFA
jgi:hypothetical protein